MGSTWRIRSFNRLSGETEIPAIGLATGVYYVTDVTQKLELPTGFSRAPSIGEALPLVHEVYNPR